MVRKAFRGCCAALLCWCAVFLLCPKAAAEEAVSPPSLSAQSAVLIAADTGKVLLAQDADTPRPMASTTKIMTALLALEEAARRDDPAVTVTEDMLGAEGSSMGLAAGDCLRLSELAAGMLLSSGNDAAEAAAVLLSGSIEAFAERMNERAAALGMENTRFVTPSGLDEEGHASTAEDMALLAREALKNRRFREIVSSESREVTFLSPAKTVRFENHNKLLALYEGCIGVKTGYTKKAGRCLVSAASRNGVTLIAVTLDDPDDWDDHMALFDYGFGLLSSAMLDGCFSGTLPVVGSARETVSVSAGTGESFSLPASMKDGLCCRVFLPAFCYAPVKKGNQVGSLRMEWNGRVLYTLPILAEEDAAAAAPTKKPGFWEQIVNRWTKTSE